MVNIHYGAFKCDLIVGVLFATANVPMTRMYALGFVLPKCSGSWLNIFQYLIKMVLAPFGKWNNNARNYGKFSIDLVDSMCNTLQSLELTIVLQLFTSI